MDTRPQLLDQVRAAIRLRHYSHRTENTYVHWVRRFILFHGKRHPAEMGAPEIEAFLSNLATAQKVAASTQNQALNALLFMYRHVLHIDLPLFKDIVRAQQPKRLPVVLTREEVKRVLSHLRSTQRVISSLLYGSGLRLLEALRLRVKDLEFDYRQIVVRDGKGRKDRVTMMPEPLIGAL